MISQHEQKIFTKVNSTKNYNKKKPEITRVIFQISEKKSIKVLIKIIEPNLQLNKY
jgi:hypothetical protein